MPVDSVVKWNNLKSNTVAPGQKLLVGWMSTEGVPDSIRNLRKGSADARSRILGAEFVKQKRIVEQRGAAFWQTKGNSKTDLYCLHRSAAPGSIIEITNMMNQKVVFAKVIGKMPQNAFDETTILIVSPSVAKLLGAKDEKFFIKSKYVEYF